MCVLAEIDLWLIASGVSHGVVWNELKFIAIARYNHTINICCEVTFDYHLSVIATAQYTFATA